MMEVVSLVIEFTLVSQEWLQEQTASCSYDGS